MESQQGESRWHPRQVFVPEGFVAPRWPKRRPRGPKRAPRLNLQKDFGRSWADLGKILAGYWGMFEGFFGGSCGQLGFMFGWMFAPAHQAHGSLFAVAHWIHYWIHIIHAPLAQWGVLFILSLLAPSFPISKGPPSGFPFAGLC